MYIRKPIALSVALVFLLGWLRSADAANLVAKVHLDPQNLYGDEVHFDVHRAGEKVGFHRARFRTEGPFLYVDTEFEIEIDFLIFTAYRFAYQSRSRWTDGTLSALEVEVDDDGTSFRLDAADDGNGFTVNSSNGSVKLETPLYPTNHWNAAVLDQKRVLNTLTGQINDVAITPVERVLVETERGEISATHYVYSGDLDTEVWYDDEGRWVKMRFKARDGSTIEYVCRRCQGPASDRTGN